jgi:DNA-binding GntR family transcriptional regulator
MPNSMYGSEPDVIQDIPSQAPEAVPVLTADAIAAELRQLILSGVYAVGVQLKQEALAKKFGVSRFPIRQALRRLEGEGLVAHTPFAGSVVASVSLGDLVEILDIRIALEMRALELAIPNMQDADFEAVRAIMGRYDGSENPREWSELNLEFHLRLYAHCGRPKLLKMIEDIVRGIDIQLRTQQSYRLGRKAPQTEHKAILRACAAKDVKKALALLKEHIEHTQIALQQS